MAKISDFLKFQAKDLSIKITAKMSESELKKKIKAESKKQKKGYIEAK